MSDLTSMCLAVLPTHPPSCLASYICRIALIPEQVPAPDSVEEKGSKKKGGAAAIESPPPVDSSVDISEAVSAPLPLHWWRLPTASAVEITYEMVRS